MSYNESIATLVKRFLDDDDWHYTFKEEDGVFNFNLNVKGKLKKVSYRIRIRKDDYVVYTYCPMNADDCKAEMAEFITRANYGLLNGNFEMDFRDGEIRYKTFVNCDETDPGTQTIKDSIYIPAAMFNRYGEGIVSVLFGIKDPEQAVKDCESDD
jgi:hypothetical protein